MEKIHSYNDIDSICFQLTNTFKEKILNLDPLIKVCSYSLTLDNAYLIPKSYQLEGINL